MDDDKTVHDTQRDERAPEYVAAAPGMDEVARHLELVSQNFDELRLVLRAQIESVAARETKLAAQIADLYVQRSGHIHEMAELEARRAVVDRLRDETIERARSLDVERDAVESRERRLEDAQRQFVERVADTERDIAERDESLEKREHAADDRSAELGARESQAAQSRAELAAGVAAFEAERAVFENLNAALRERQSVVADEKTKLTERQTALELAEKEASELRENLNERERLVAKAELDLAEREERLDVVSADRQEKESESRARSRELEALDTELSLASERLASREGVLDAREAELEAKLQERWGDYEVAAELLEEQLDAFQLREQAFDQLRTMMSRMSRALIEPTPENIAAADDDVVASAVAAYASLRTDGIAVADDEKSDESCDSPADSAEGGDSDDGSDEGGTEIDDDAVCFESQDSQPQADDQFAWAAAEQETTAGDFEPYTIAEALHTPARMDSARATLPIRQQQRESVDVSDLTGQELLKFRKLSRMSTDSEVEIVRWIREVRPQGMANKKERAPLFKWHVRSESE